MHGISVTKQLCGYHRVPCQLYPGLKAQLPQLQGHTTRRVSILCAAKGGKKVPIGDRLRSSGQSGNLAPAPPPSTSAPPPVAADIPAGPSAGTSAVQLTNPNQPLQLAWRRLLKELSSLPRAIAIMFMIAGLSGLGTVIPQNKPLEYYMASYPSEAGPKVLGFLTYEWIYALDLNHIYTSWYFYLSLGLLAASLTACTYTRQWPAVKVAQRWRFFSRSSGVIKMGNAEVLPAARLSDLGQQLMSKGYQVFIQGPSLYAFKGLAGKLGPIGVHAALLLILFGAAFSGVGGLKGTVMCPEGQDFIVGSTLYPSSPIAPRPGAFDKVVHVDDFSIDYRPDGSVAQFYSTLTLNDPEGRPLMSKTISVNDPFRYGGVTMYQTDWSLAAVTLRVLNPDNPLATSDDIRAYNLPLASLEGRPGIAGRLWASFLPLADPPADGSAPRGVSILARDLQSVVFYDSKGQFVGVRRPGSGKPIEVEGVQVVVDDVVGSTGLELKADPGVPLVYAGFGGLMITTLISYLSHSQVWAVQEGQYVYVAGRSNRAVIWFERELDAVLEGVPELPSSTMRTPSSNSSADVVKS
mmetsp:Transcript_7898/g.16927  ORF Transcript_7898/g.16927 Transcript_7898/m.16927 type:complete len:578 (-) Transcript_7898:1713-3446(-)